VLHDILNESHFFAFLARGKTTPLHQVQIDRINPDGISPSEPAETVACGIVVAVRTGRER